MFEQVVRPFETPNTIRDKSTIVTTVTKKVVARAVLVWGAAGKQPEPTSLGISFKVIDPFEYKETDRKTTDVRIENPNDSSQYVIAQRIDSITFERTKKSDGGNSSSGSSSGTKEVASSDGTSTFITGTNDDTTTADTAGGTSTQVKVSDTTSETLLRGASSSSSAKEKDTFKLKQPSS